MKLSQLIPHTSEWLGIRKVTVESVAKYLRPAGLITSGGRGPGGAEMTVDDKINLFLGVCGVEVANRAADHVRAMLSLPQNKHAAKKSDAVLDQVEEPSFIKSSDLKSALVTMFSDIKSGELQRWCQAIEAALHSNGLADSDRATEALTVVFEIDADYVTIKPTCTFRKGPGTWSVSLTMTFGRQRETTLPGTSRRTHEISLERLIGWGTCLTE